MLLVAREDQGSRTNKFQKRAENDSDIESFIVEIPMHMTCYLHMT